MAFPTNALAVPVTISASPAGTIRISPGEAVSAGYAFRLPGVHAAAQVTFENAMVAIAGRCTNGASASVTVPLAGGPYSVAANAGGRSETGTVRAPANLCAGGMFTAGDATFLADVQSTVPGGVDLDFHYRSARSASPSSSLPVTISADTVREAPRAKAPATPPPAVPGLRIATLQQPAAGGPRVDYRIVVTNTSGSALAVQLSAPRCDAGTLSPSPTQIVFAGTSLAWECSHVLSARNGSAFANIAAAIGTTRDGAQFGPVASTAPLPGGMTAARKVLSRPKPVSA